MTIVYTPELGEKKTPFAAMEAKLSYYGKHFYVYTSIELKGRGIKKLSTSSGKNEYKVTKSAFEKIEKEYTIAMCSFLD